MSSRPCATSFCTSLSSEPVSTVNDIDDITVEKTTVETSVIAPWPLHGAWPSHCNISLMNGYIKLWYTMEKEALEISVSPAFAAPYVLKKLDSIWSGPVPNLFLQLMAGRAPQGGLQVNTTTVIGETRLQLCVEDQQAYCRREPALHFSYSMSLLKRM